MPAQADLRVCCLHGFAFMLCVADPVGYKEFLLNLPEVPARNAGTVESMQYWLHPWPCIVSFSQELGGAVDYELRLGTAAELEGFGNTLAQFQWED